MGRPKKTERFRVKRHRNQSGTYSWQVSGTKRDGERVRKLHATEEQALEHKGELELEYAGSQREARLRTTTLSESQLLDATTAYKHAGDDKSLAWIVQQYLALEDRANAQGASLTDAIKFFEAHYKPEIVEIRVGNAIEHFLKTKSALRLKSLEHYKTSLKLLTQDYSEQPLNRIGVAEVEAVLAPYSNRNTLSTYRRGLVSFFNWALRHHHVLENPCKRLDPLPADTTHVAILSLDEVKRLLTSAIRYADGVMVPTIAIGLFAGLRPSEITDLKPTDVKEDFIAVAGGKMRRKLKRRVPITKSLNQWLKAFPFVGTPEGYGYKLKQLKKATDAANWKQDVIRHTSITYQLERDEDEARTAFNNGTSREMINLHYRDVLENPADCETYWGLTPKMIDSLGLGVKLPASQGTKWPSDKALAKLVKEKPLTHIANELGISDSAVRKRCKKRGIELPRNGYWQKNKFSVIA